MELGDVVDPDALPVIAGPVHAEPLRRVLEPALAVDPATEVVVTGSEPPDERVVLVGTIQAPPLGEGRGLDSLLPQLGHAPERQVLAVAPAGLDDVRDVQPVLGAVLPPVHHP